mgnify:CR=1 FL=1
MDRRTFERIISPVGSAIVILILILYLTPIWWGISTSLKPWEYVYTWPPRWWAPGMTLFFYYKIFVSRPLFHWIWNSLLYAGATTGVVLLFSSIASYSLVRFRFRGSGKVSFALIATRFIPPISLTVPIFLMSRAWGLYNTLTILVLVTTYLNLPTQVWLLKAYFEAIPWEMEESAMIDGCTRLGAFFRVIVPMCAHFMASAAIITFLGCWNAFYWPLVLTSGPENEVIGLGIYHFIGDGMTYTNEICAGGIIFSLPAILLCVFAGKYILRGLAVGGLKGL